MDSHSIKTAKMDCHVMDQHPCKELLQKIYGLNLVYNRGILTTVVYPWKGFHRMKIWPPNKRKCSQDHKAEFQHFKNRIPAPKTFTQEMAEKCGCKICSHLQKTTMKHLLKPNQLAGVKSRNNKYIIKYLACYKGTCRPLFLSQTWCMEENINNISIYLQT